MLSLSAFAQQAVLLSNHWVEQPGGSVQRIVHFGTENVNDTSGQMRLSTSARHPQAPS